MSKKKNLEWICRRCAKAEFAKPEVAMVIAKDTELLKPCSFCGTGNWCFPVTSGRPVKGGKKAPKEPETLKEVIDEARVANSEAIDTHILKPETGTNTTDALVYDEITAPEAESPEENEALEEAVDEALEAVIEEAVEIEKEPEETPLEAERKPSREVLSGDIDIGPLNDEIEAKNTKIAELEARLEALKK